MLLTVKQGNSTISEFRFAKGPIYIGRHRNSQIFLQHRAVSRQHAVIFNTQDGKWMVEDLDSANKTYLNNQPVHKTQIKTGDVLRIIEFLIEIDLERDMDVDKPIDLEDTLTKTAYAMKTPLAAPAQDIIIREPEVVYGPAVRLPAKRLTDFSQATQVICKAGSADELLLTLLEVTIRQFGAQRTWCALRVQPGGPMTSHAGKQRDGRAVELGEIKLNEKITQAVESGQYLVLPQVSAVVEGEEKVRSAMIAPIMRPAGCFGVIYVDNRIDQAYYSLSDLDYLILITISTGAVLEKLARHTSGGQA
ncbi:MAG TPA: FHA domain-containing protein [Sedimentisphaerales bacterium]|nr:FHA domain-containing protein [Sedimentisphaerales bacterium]